MTPFFRSTAVLLWIATAISPSSGQVLPGQCSTQVTVLTAGCKGLVSGATFAERLGQTITITNIAPGVYNILGPCLARVSVSGPDLQNTSFVLDQAAPAIAIFLECTNPEKFITVSVSSRCQSTLQYLQISSNDVTSPIKVLGGGHFSMEVCRLPVSVMLRDPGHVDTTVTLTSQRNEVILECNDALVFTLGSSCGDGLSGTTLKLADGTLTADQSNHFPATVFNPGLSGDISLTCRSIGHWSPWTYPIPCSVTCNGGTRLRSRFCINSPGGLPCIGTATETVSCNTGPCPVDGAWGSWVDDGACTVTCGGGTRARIRPCDNPAPINPGQLCSGTARDTLPCNTQPCAVDGAWAEWDIWGTCQITCTTPSSGTAQQTRSRTCSNPAPAFGGASCTGMTQDTRPCQTFPCRSCKDVILANSNAPDGQYVLVTGDDEQFTVFCAFDGGDAATFLSPSNTANIDISTLFTSTSDVIIASLDTGTVSAVPLSQLDAFSGIPLSIQYNQNDGYKTPINAASMGPYLYLGLLPIIGIGDHDGATEGYNLFDTGYTFTNCGGNPNSYFAFLFNQNSNTLVDYSADTVLIKRWISEATPTPVAIPVSYFTDFEVHMGGCGGYIDTTDTSLTGAALGLLYEVTAADSVLEPSLCACAGI